MKFKALTAIALVTFAASASAEVVKVPLGAPPVIPVSNATAADEADRVRLNTNVTVTGDAVHLGDIFTGYLARPEKVVANAPAPGQRTVLSAEWLENLSRTYGLGWRPAGAYDRATVYQPGQTITQEAMLSAVRAALATKGLPTSYDVVPISPIESITVSMAAGTTVGVREATFDATTRAFSAVVEIPAGDPEEAVFIPMRGEAYAVAKVPVLKETANKNQVITAAMIDVVKVRAELVKPATVTDPAALIGKSPVFMVKAGLPVLENEIVRVRMVEVPVLRTVGTREDRITKDEIAMITVNAADLSPDAVLDPAQLLGKTPRRTLTAGAPINASDVILVRKLTVPVLARDVEHGTIVTAADLTTTTITESQLINNVLASDNAIVGRVALQDLRAGQLIHGFNVARQIVLERGKVVTIVYSVPLMNLTALGVTRDQGAVGDVVHVTNNKSNTVVVAEVVDANTVRIGPKEASKPGPAQATHASPKQTASAGH